MESDDAMKQGIRHLIKSTKAIYEGDLRQDGLYRVAVDPSEEKAAADGSEEVNIEKANLHIFPRIRSRAVAEGARYLRLCLGHTSKRTMAQVAKSCLETAEDPPILNWPKTLTAKAINENWTPCARCKS